ncbi:MAG: hypothetical protein WC123_07675 [Bacilli bacterium]|nr:hypothetical protein [Bacilli bacterium]
MLNNRFKKTASATIALLFAFLVTACGGTSTTTSSSSSTSQPTSGNISSGVCDASNLTLEEINAYLNDPTVTGMLNGNEISIIPFKHINGHGDEWDFFAFVAFQYQELLYVKYQVTYLSCTCRAANVNFWQTIYLELSLPASGDVKDSKIRKLTFDEVNVGNETYLGGFWGDSDPIPDSPITYEIIKQEFIPYLEGKTKSQVDAWSDIWDIDISDYQQGDGRSSYDLDKYVAATVSTNNIIRIVQAIFDYHGKKYVE